MSVFHSLTKSAFHPIGACHGSTRFPCPPQIAKISVLSRDTFPVSIFCRSPQPYIRSVFEASLA